MKLATPLFPVTPTVFPVSSAPVGFVARDICTFAPRSALPRLSTTVTFTEGVICDAAEEVLLGCVPKLIDKLLATLMEKEAFADCCGELESAALTAKENRPIEVDEPLRMPAVLRVIPGGSWPLAGDHATGGLRPGEGSLWLFREPNKTLATPPYAVATSTRPAPPLLTAP